MADERKASEILLSLEVTIKEILGYVRNLDLQQKIILERLNTSTSSKSAPLLVEAGPQVEAIPEDYEFPEHNPKALKSKLQTALEEAEKEDQEEEITATTKQIGHRRNLRNHGEQQIRQIPVQQKISYADGKNVYMANVQILDSNNNIIKQTKTNQTGKWLASLAPGDYKVMVSKSGTTLKPKVELSYSVTIPIQDSTVELEKKVVG